jgi:hypothetical protein
MNIKQFLYGLFLCRHKHTYLFLEDMPIGVEVWRKATCDKCNGSIRTQVLLHTVDKGSTTYQLCSKHRYKIKKHAETVLNAMQKKRRKKQANRIYYCSKCQGWHLTSSEKLQDNEYNYNDTKRT